MQVLLTTLNTKYIHKNLALRWLYVAAPDDVYVEIQEYTINEALDAILLRMRLEKFDVIGISVYIWNAELIKTWITLIKKINPLIRIILGGPEVSYENDEWFQFPIDAVIQGEGEQVFWDYLADKHPLAVKTGCGKNPYQAKTDLKWLETLTNPYFLPFDLPDINQRYLYIEGSRGCPHHCQYCLSSTDNHVRFFSLDYLFRIFDLLSQYQIRQVKFLDRTFNVNNARALLLITYLNKMSTKSNFHLELVAETLSDELLAYLENELASDRFRFEIGVQSFNQTTLQAVGRYTDTKRLAEVIGKLRRHDNLLHTDLIAGLPFEDFRSFATSYNTLYRLAPHEIQVGILKLLKGTALRNQAEQLRIDYNVTAPYEIIANPWLSAADLNQIKLVHRATEKCYNNQKLQHTLHELVSYQRLAPFDLMLRLGQAIERLPHPYQEREFYQSLIQELVPVVPYDLLSGLLAVDYYRGTKQKPSPLFELIDYHSYLDVLSLNSMADQQMLDNYCLMTAVVYKNRRLVQLIVYNTKQMPALRYIIDRENSQIKELL